VTLEVPLGVSILEALRRHGFVVPSSCESGTCGSCRTKLLAGVADHRDFVLDEEEQKNEIMICVSRARSGALTLDI
jgi:phthalate 4,5-dioxygenase reductase subunit